METRPPQSGFETPSSSSAIHTFLIADLRGYTRFVDERGDEAAARLTQRFAAIASEVVAARAGRVIEVRGDEVLAVFGSAREGIRAAVDLQAAVRSGRDPDVPLNAGIGLDAGEAVPVGDGFRGRALNMAARLCARAEPGEILITPELVHLVGVMTGVAFEDKGPVHLKGFSRPVHMHAVVPATAAGAGASTGALEIRTLGAFGISRDGQPVELAGRRDRQILAHLLLAANHVVTIDTLTAQIWAADPPKAARSTVRRHVETLRSLLGPERIERTGAGFALRVETDEVDLLRFEQLLRRGHRASATDPAQAVSIFEQALELWRGPPFGDVADDAGLHADGARFDELRVGAIETMIEARLALGEHTQVVPDLQRLVDAYPLRQRLWANLMLALYRSGRHVEAHGAFARATVAADGPSSQLRELDRRMREEDPELELRGVPLRSYRLLEPIGEGSLGVVWRALDPSVDREVAIKQVRPAFARDADFVRRFEQEARVVAGLEHPHIVPVYDSWRDASGAHLVMRLMRGGSLTDRMAAGPLSPAGAVSVATDVAAALGAAHRRGLVHRDVSPGNVLLDEDGNAYLSDFGLALSGTSPRVYQASHGFRSPEQLAGQPLTPQSDIYSLGALLREMLQTASEKPASALDAVIARATAAEPSQRFADAEQFSTALTAAVDARPAAAMEAAPARNPYKGLRPFGELDAEDFFGREALVRELVAALDSRSPGHRFLTVVGPSGSGKSSAVRAGLIPALRAGAVPGSEHWIYTDMLPGSRPMEELEASLLRVAFDPMPWLIDELDRDESGLARAVERVLPPGDAELVLLIDQFEELFTLVDDEEARARFVDSLVAAVADPHSRIRVIATLRADFYDRPLLLPGLAEHVRAQTQTVLPLSAEELESAISGPAERVGVVAERVLVAEMIGDVLGQPGGLPLLQYALSETFEACRGGALTLEGYRATGGVTGALAKRAEQLYAELDAPAKDAARQLFLRLVSVGQGSEDTRRLVPLAELASLPIDRSAIDSVIDRFGSHRMLSFDRDPDSRGPTIEVAHEALLREWGRLRGWIDGAREDVIMRRRLEAEAGEWERAGRDPSFLLRGSRLGQFEAWAEASNLALSAHERDYLQESIDAREAEAAEEHQRQAKERALERRSIRRLRALVAAMAIAAVIAVALSAVALSQRGRAEQRGRLATARELATASQANLEVDPERSVLLALAAARETHQDGGAIPEAISALHSAVGADRTLRRFGGWISASPDGRILSNGRQVADGAELVMLDAGTLQPLATLHAPSLVDAQFSPDSRRLMVATEDGTLLFWDTHTWEALPSIELNRHVSLGGSAWSPDLRTVSVVGDDGIVSVVDTRSGREVQRISHADDGVGYLYTAFSRDGTRVAATVNFGGDYVPIWDVRSGREVVRVGVDGGSFGVAFSPDGSRVATTGPAGRADVWNADTGRHLLSLLGHTGNVWYVAYSADAQRIGTAGSDGTARIWDANDGRQLMVLHGHAGDVYGVHFSPSGRDVQTYGADHTGRLWDISPGGSRELLTLDGGGGVEAVEFSGDGRRLLSDQYNGSVRIWDGASGEESLAAGSGGDGVAFSPDARQYVTGGTPAIWDAGTGRHVRDLTLPAPDSIWMSNIAYSSDGSLVAGALGNTTPQSGTVALWDAQSGRRIGTLGRPGGSYDAVRRVVFSSDDTLVAGVTEAGRLHVWRRAGGREILSRDVVNGGGNGVAFSPDGSLVAASGSTGVSLWRTGDGTLAARLPGAANVQSVQFSPDGRLLATGGQDEIVRIWDVESSRTILTLAGHTAAINSVAFSPDGTRVASGGDDGTVRVYSLDTDQLIGLAEARVTRNFTAAECRQYLHKDRCPASGSRPLNHQHELWTQSAADDPAPEGAYRVALDRSDFPAGFNGVEDQIGVYTLSLEMGSWRLLQVKPSGETWERAGTYRVDAGRRLLLTDRNDPECFGTVISASWSHTGTSLSFRNVRTTVTPTCGRRGLIVARATLASHPWSTVVV